MKIVRTAILLLIVTSSIFAAEKDVKTTIQKVTGLIKREQFDEAKTILTAELDKNPGNILLIEQMGIVCFSMDNGEREAIHYLTQAVNYYNVNNIVSKSSLDDLYYLSMAYHINGQYDEALETILLAKTQIPANEVGLSEKVDRVIIQLQVAIELKKNPLQFKTTNLGPKINSPYEEHSPVVSSDETRLIFTSTRPKKGSAKNDLLTESIWESTWDGNSWSTPKSLPAEINSDGYNASCSLSFDGKTLFFYRSDGTEGDIYTTQLSGDGIWGKATKLPRPINSYSDETHAAISADGSMLFFTSNRAGGFGGLDIYVVRKLPNGEWSKEQNLGPTINTPDDEESPFLHADGRTLYFSSRGHDSSGAFDIFSSTMDDDGVWGKPVNIGYPLNTPDDDLFYQPTVDGQRVYYMSHQNIGEGGADLYLLEYLDTDRRAMAAVTCSANAVNNDSTINASLTVKEIGTARNVGTYKCNPSTGKFIVILPVGKRYTFDFSYPGCEIVTRELEVPPRSEYFTTRKTITIEAIEFVPKAISK